MKHGTQTEQPGPACRHTRPEAPAKTPSAPARTLPPDRQNTDRPATPEQTPQGSSGLFREPAGHPFAAALNSFQTDHPVGVTA